MNEFKQKKQIFEKMDSAFYDESLPIDVEKKINVTFNSI